MTQKLLPFVFIFGLSSCTLLNRSEEALIDVRKICSEYPRLVEKILPFRERDFSIRVDQDPRLGEWQTWELNKGVAKRYQMSFLNLRFEKNKLRTIWWGPRTEWMADLKRMGLYQEDLLAKSGKRIDTYNLGEYRTQDFSGRRITLEYDLPHSEGITVRCF